MIIINPQQFPSGSITSNAAISVNALWNIATPYTTGQAVYYWPAGDLYPRDYEALTASTGVQPDTDPTKWLDLGVSNRYAMFDGVIGDATTGPVGVPLTVTLALDGVANGLAFFGLSGNTIRIRVDDSVDGVVYDQTFDLNDSYAITDWFAYFFEPIAPLGEITIIDLPSYRSADLIIDVDAGAGSAQIGEMVAGFQRSLGVSNFGTQVGIRSFSRKDTDEFGNVSVVRRRNAKIADFDVTVETAQAYMVQRTLSALDSVPTVFIGDANKQETVVYGFYLDFKILIAGPQVSDCTIQVEGLV